MYIHVSLQKIHDKYNLDNYDMNHIKGNFALAQSLTMIYHSHAQYSMLYRISLFVHH